jgi:peptidyl-prolyl cis-trans isomerase SurA
MLIKKLITYLMFVFLIITTNTFGLENKILVKIEREIITKIDIENETKYLLALNKNINDLSESEIFEISKNSIIKEKIQNIEIKKNFKDLKIPEKYLEQILESVYQRIRIKDLDTFKNYLKDNDVDYEFVKKKIEIEALWNELIIAKFSSNIKINEKKIHQDLLENNSKFLKSFLLSEIFFESSNKNEAQEIYNKIKKTIKKEGFDRAVLTYSLSSTSKNNGDLGWIVETSLNNNLKKTFLNMKKGDLTDLIAVPGGFMILKIKDIKKIENNQNIEKELNKIINIKKNNQLNQYSKMYFSKIKKNIQINEL